MTIEGTEGGLPAAAVRQARAILAEATERYDEASWRWEAVRESCPELPPRSPLDRSPEAADVAAWRRLMDASDESYRSAEEALAAAMERLLAMAGPAGGDAGGDDGRYCSPKVVRYRGVSYVLSYLDEEDDPMRPHIVACRDSAAVSIVNRRLSTLRRAVRVARRLGLVDWSLDVELLRSEAYRDTETGRRRLLPTPEGCDRRGVRTEGRSHRRGI
jgi:hypothetical protein